MHKLSDQELSFKVAAYQDSDAFAELYQRYFALLQKFIYFRISAKEDAEDLAAFEERAKEPNLAFEAVLKDLRRRGRL